MGFKGVKVSANIPIDSGMITCELEYELEEEEVPSHGLERCRVEIEKYKDVLKAVEVLGNDKISDPHHYTPATHGPYHTIGVRTSVATMPMGIATQNISRGGVGQVRLIPGGAYTT